MSSARLSVAVMAHPARAEMARALAFDVRDREHDVWIVWDDGDDEWCTGSRALGAHACDATHHLVIQDDALPCRDLIAGLTVAASHAGEAVICAYTGRPKPRAALTRFAAREAERARSPWVVMPGPLWGVALVLPTAIISDLLAFKTNEQKYDSRIKKFLKAAKVECWNVHPSIVDHRVGPSLLPGDKRAQRTAVKMFEDSALKVAWGVPPVRLPACGYGITDEGRFICTGCGYVFGSEHRAREHAMTGGGRCG